MLDIYSSLLDIVGSSFMTASFDGYTMLDTHSSLAANLGASLSFMAASFDLYAMFHTYPSLDGIVGVSSMAASFYGCTMFNNYSSHHPGIVGKSYMAACLVFSQRNGIVFFGSHFPFSI